MGKQELETRKTNLSSPHVQGQEERTIVTYDDNILPSPNELQQYKIINPGLIDFFIDASRNEQQHRHKIEKLKLRALNRDSKNIRLINILGMSFAFLTILSGFAFSFYLLLNNKELIGTIFAGGIIVLASSLFLKKVKKINKK